MLRIFLILILILGCDMAEQYTNYSTTDDSPDNIISAIDLDSKGLMRLSLTNWENTSKPDIAEESIVENGGARFRTTGGDDSISLIDPVTSTTVADGDVYILLDGDSGDYFFTATEPTWNDEKQGYYLTGLYSAYRAVGGCFLNSGSYTRKYVYDKRSVLRQVDYKIEAGAGITWFNIAGSADSAVLRVKKPLTVILQINYFSSGGSTELEMDFYVYYNSSWVLSARPSLSAGLGTGTIHQILHLTPGDYKITVTRTTGTHNGKGFLIGCYGNNAITSPDVYEFNP